MNHRIIPVAAAIVVASVAILAAQLPSTPANLRVVTGGAETPPPPPPPPPTPCVIPASGGPAHAYFDALVRRSEHVCNWALRSQAELNGLVADPVATNFTYNPAADTHPDRQDAAKFVLMPGGSSSISGKQQLRMSIPALASGSVLLSWDWYWGREFRDNRGAVNHYKMFQAQIGGHSWWTLMSGMAWASDTDERQVGMPNDQFRSGTLADGVLKRGPFTPAGPGTPDQTNNSGSQYPQHHSVWTRYWIEVKMLQPPSAFREWSDEYLGGAPLGANPDDPEGRWHMVSLWMADENRAPRRLIYRAPLNWNAALGWDPRLTLFRFEMNTSQSADSLDGPLVGYARNTVLLHNYALPAVPETDTFIFQRPRR